MVQRLEEFQQTIFATMSAKAAQCDAVNLGQGFPDEDGPASMLQIAQREIAEGNNQYAPGPGMPVLRQAIASHQRRYDLDVAESEVLVTVGATEAITATIMGLVEPGQEVILIEPYYDAYAAAVALAGATRVAVSLQAKGDTWELDPAAIEAAITPKTAMIVINNPHNPTGSVFSSETMCEISRIACVHDLLVLSDEVYEHLLFDATRHRPTCTYPGMAQRTVTVSSAAKTFNATGWKTGWAIAPPPLLEAIAQAKQFLTFVGATPFQPAVAHALNHEQSWADDLSRSLEKKRDKLSAALRKAGFRVHYSPGTYYLVADFAALSNTTGMDFCMELVKDRGVAAIPLEVFCDHPEPWRSKIRFAFCKQDHVIDEAIRRLS
ncbi:pyridoxal phosphate-dependent aminotransferase [Corynebacterium gerontici]|uniref:Putative N-succinyldiaminopimelate aminotransferase DapC n=1 Tax=Corynebacterium gerontici TaxID=2079234 RepID=A0A3G6IYV4_9CORY|nr:pyridoxal phosphate-dependent aminotransferase [Corynebacterium gerontici]AZA10959.1 putative N-succinyldiaminopimelate aminotransferase DapC [Corynebacterium gerontici]